MEHLSQIDDLLRALLQDLQSRAALIQAAIVVVALAAGWILSTRFNRRLVGYEAAGWRRRGRGGLARVAFPLAALVLLILGKIVYGTAKPSPFLNIAVSLVTAFALVRLIVYMLRLAFPPHPWLKTGERYVAVLLWVSVALYITGLDRPIVAWLEKPLRLGTYRFSLLAVVTAAGSVVVTLLVALWLARLLETRLMEADTLDTSLRVVLGKFFRALLLVVAVLFSLSFAGIDLTVLSVFGGALGVGLGFGLQKVASNYVSGFIILLDRSIRPGDMITADNRYGKVSRLSTRYTVVRSLDGTEAIIPNDTLMTTTVVNHSYTDHRISLTLPVQVGYQSPLEEVLQMLIKAVGGEARVLPEPAPTAVIKGFGDNGIDLELQFWIGDPENGQAVLKSNVLLAIWRSFKQHQIEIPYPQRDLRLIATPELGEDWNLAKAPKSG